MKTPVESNENATSEKKLVKKLTLNRETVRSMGVKTRIRTGIVISWDHRNCGQSENSAGIGESSVAKSIGASL